MRVLRPSLTVSILAFLSTLLLLTWLLFSLFALRTAANDLYAQKAQHARMLLDAFVSQLPSALPTYPEGMLLLDSAAVTYAKTLVDNDDFTRLTLLDSNGKCIYTAGKEGSDIYGPFAGQTQTGTGSAMQPDGAGVAWVSSVVRDGAQVARVGLLLSLSAEKERLKRSRQLYMAYFAIDFILLLGFGAFILSRIVVTPVNRLLAATEKITGGHYGQQVRISGSSELVSLGEAFNAMSATLLQKDQQVTAHVAALEKANSDLLQARAETLHSEKMASIGLLAAGMAHEVGTPLASIMGYAELLTEDEPENSAIRDYAQRISQDCARIDRIVRGLLDYSRPRSSAVEPVDIRELVVDTVGLLSRQGAFKGISGTSQFDDGLPLVEADPHQLQQVLINLMLNSRDAMPDGGKLTVRASYDRTAPLPVSPEGCLRLDVTDSGGGIPPEHLARLFDPFFTTKPPGKGTGLGLAIVARIIEGLGGRITIQSTIGQGSCFTLWLPLASAHEEP